MWFPIEHTFRIIYTFDTIPTTVNIVGTIDEAYRKYDNIKRMKNPKFMQMDVMGQDAYEWINVEIN